MVNSDIKMTAPVEELGAAWSINLGEICDHLAKAKWKILFSLVTGFAVGLSASYLVSPTYVAKTMLLPPQQQQGGVAAALGSIGALAGLQMGGGIGKSLPDQYIGLMQSENALNKIVDDFHLKNEYKVDYQFEARQILLKNTSMGGGKKDGLITIEVEDRDPQRAADIANRFVRELVRINDDVAITEAQRRRVFFESRLRETKVLLEKAQKNLSGAKFDENTISSEPKAAAESFARLKAELSAAEVRLSVMRQSVSSESQEYKQQLAKISALTSLLRRENPGSNDLSGRNYIDSYREYKYQETLYEIFVKQYEIARVDEAKEGPVVQVIDKAVPPEKKSAPKRGGYALAGTALGLLICFLFIWRRRVRK